MLYKSRYMDTAMNNEFWGIFIFIGAIIYCGTFVAGSISLYMMEFPYWFVPIGFLLIQATYFAIKEITNEQ